MVEQHRTLELLDRLSKPFFRAQIPVEAAFQVGAVRISIFCERLCNLSRLILGERRTCRSQKVLRDPRLKVRQVGGAAVVALSPCLCAARHIHEVHLNVERVVPQRDAARDHCFHAERPPRRLRVDG